MDVNPESDFYYLRWLISFVKFVTPSFERNLKISCTKVFLMAVKRSS